MFSFYPDRCCGRTYPYSLFSRRSGADPKGSGANRFKQLVEEKWRGKVVVEVFPNAKL
ncbi:MAG: hypothetical protein IPL99_28915 [Candidatus Competibacteraceae bacterium]|nr:hypothetical protein [Candidatus Competibacteraceae bacterium]